MLEMRKLSREEVKQEMQVRKPSPRSEERRKMIEQFKDLLSKLQPGEGGEIKIVDRRQRTTIKNRLLRAAEELGVKIAFIRKRGRIVFYIPEPEGEQKSEGTGPDS